MKTEFDRENRYQTIDEKTFFISVEIEIVGVSILCRRANWDGSPPSAIVKL